MATTNWAGSGDVRVTGEGQQTAPAAAALVGGGYVIAWLVSGSSASGDFSEVHAQRFDAAGARLGGELLLSQGPAYGVPAVAGLADGGFVASWDARADPLANTNYLARRFDASGNPLGDAVQANLASNPDSAGSVEAAALAGGGFLVQWWMDPGGPTFWGPQLQLYGAGGAPVGGDTPLGYEADGTPFGDGTYIHSAATAPTADGGYVAVWATATTYQPGAGTIDRVYVQRFDAAGQAVAAPAQATAVPSTAALIDGVEAAVLAGSGDVVISTRGVLADGGVQITAQRFDTAGHALGAQQSIVLASAVLDSRVTALAGGDFVVSWLDSQAQGQPQVQVQTVYAQRFDSLGNKSGDPVLVGTAQALYAHYTATATADGGAVFAWDDGRMDSGDVYAERFAPSAAGDQVPPTVVAFSPADEAGNVPVNSNIVASFSEAIQRGSGSILLKDAAGSVVAAYDAATSSNLGISGATLTINPSADLAPATGYVVEFAAGSVRDASGNAYAGTSSYNFTTAPPAGSGVTIVGGSGPDNLVGTSAADTLRGLDGRDVLTGLGGDDLLDGGAGLDSAMYSNARGSYGIARTSQGLAVSGPEGNDTLVDVERLKFSDVSVAFDVQGSAGQAWRLYQAAFDRAPDVGGLGFWINGMDNGQPLLEVSNYFMTSAEFASKYGSLGTTQFVVQLYANVLHRAPDEGGQAYWVGHLEQGDITRAETLMYFSESAENQTALIGTIQNGMTYTG